MCIGSFNILTVEFLICCRRSSLVFPYVDVLISTINRATSALVEAQRQGGAAPVTTQQACQASDCVGLWWKRYSTYQWKKQEEERAKNLLTPIFQPTNLYTTYSSNQHFLQAKGCFILWVYMLFSKEKSGSQATHLLPRRHQVHNTTQQGSPFKTADEKQRGSTNPWN